MEFPFRCVKKQRLLTNFNQLKPKINIQVQELMKIPKHCLQKANMLFQNIQVLVQLYLILEDLEDFYQ
jgi:hypothetical protein